MQCEELEFNHFSGRKEPVEPYKMHLFHKYLSHFNVIFCENFNFSNSNFYILLYLEIDELLGQYTSFIIMYCAFLLDSSLTHI